MKILCSVMRCCKRMHNIGQLLKIIRSLSCLILLISSANELSYRLDEKPYPGRKLGFLYIIAKIKQHAKSER